MKTSRDKCIHSGCQCLTCKDYICRKNNCDVCFDTDELVIKCPFYRQTELDISNVTTVLKYLRNRFAFHLNICEKSTILASDDFHKGLNEGRIDALKSCIDDIDKLIDECNNKNRED